MEMQTGSDDERMPTLRLEFFKDLCKHQASQLTELNAQVATQQAHISHLEAYISKLEAKANRSIHHPVNPSAGVVGNALGDTSQHNRSTGGKGKGKEIKDEDVDIILPRGLSQEFPPASLGVRAASPAFISLSKRNRPTVRREAEDTAALSLVERNTLVERNITATTAVPSLPRPAPEGRAAEVDGEEEALPERDIASESTKADPPPPHTNRGQQAGVVVPEASPESAKESGTVVRSDMPPIRGSQNRGEGSQSNGHGALSPPESSSRQAVDSRITERVPKVPAPPRRTPAMSKNSVRAYPSDERLAAQTASGPSKAPDHGVEEDLKKRRRVVTALDSIAEMSKISLSEQSQTMFGPASERPKGGDLKRKRRSLCLA